MPYTTVYLHYVETRSDAADYEDTEDTTESEDDDEEAYDYSSDRTYVEFTPVALTTKEHRGEHLEVELDFPCDVGSTLHLVIVRYNNPSTGAIDDWCLESVFKTLEEAEELVERLEEGAAGAACTETGRQGSVTVTAEVFSLTVRK